MSVNVETVVFNIFYSVSVGDVKLSSPCHSYLNYEIMLSRSYITSRGHFRFSNKNLSNSQIIHFITQIIHQDIFKVKSIAIFENPICAEIHLIFDSPNRLSFMKKFRPSRRSDSKSEQVLKVTLKLTDKKTKPHQHHLKFKIEANQDLKPRQATLMNRQTNKISQTISDAINAMEEKQTPPQYPRLVYSK